MGEAKCHLLNLFTWSQGSRITFESFSFEGWGPKTPLNFFRGDMCYFFVFLCGGPTAEYLSTYDLRTLQLLDSENNLQLWRRRNLKNSNCEKFLKHKVWQNLKAQITTKLQNSNSQNSDCEKTSNKILWKNLKTKIGKLKKVILWNIQKTQNVTIKIF